MYRHAHRGVLATGAGWLVDALQNGRLGGAGLDVFSSEQPIDSALLYLANMALSPHIGGSIRAGSCRMGDVTAEDCLRALHGLEPLSVVQPEKESS